MTGFTQESTSIPRKPTDGHAEVRGHVTLIGPFPPPYGGVSVHLVRLTEALRDRGWSVGTLSAGRKRPGTQLTSPFLGNSLLKHYVTVLRHARGVVHIHERIPPLTYLATLAARTARCPVVTTVHGVPHSIFSREPGVDLFLRYALGMAGTIIAVHEEVAEFLREHGVSAPIVVTPAFLPPSASELNEVDPDVNSWLGTSGDLPLLTVLVYRLLPPLSGRSDIYGLSLVAPALEHLASKGRSVRLALLLAQRPDGPLEEEFLSRAESDLRRLLGGRLGLFIEKYAPPVIARSRVLVRPTTTDGDPVSIREAMCLGVPVVASDAVTRPPGTVLHASEDPISLAEAIERALALPPGCRSPRSDSLGTSCVGRLEEIYSDAKRHGRR